MTSTTTTPSLTMRLNPAALALAFGVAGAVVLVLIGSLMEATWGMMGGAGGWMHGSAVGGHGYGGSMMGGGLGFFGYGVVCGFLGGAVAGGVSASVYNSIMRSMNSRPR